MEMMTGNTLRSVTTRREQTTQPGRTPEENVLQSFFRANGGKKALPQNQRGISKNSENVLSMAQEAPLDATGRFRVLLIAKEQRERQAICSTLSRNLNFATAYFEASGGELALQTIAREVIDLIIFEDNIADMDGMEFLGRLNRKQGKSKTPVISILNPSSAKAGMKAMKMGVHDYLFKDSDGHHFELLPILVARIYADQQVPGTLHQETYSDATLADSQKLEAELTHYRKMLDDMVRARTEQLDRRIAILESCNSSLGENYHKIHQMYLDLLIKTQAHE